MNKNKGTQSKWSGFSAAIIGIQIMSTALIIQVLINSVGLCLKSFLLSLTCYYIKKSIKILLVIIITLPLGPV